MDRLDKTLRIGKKLEIHLYRRIWDGNYSELGYKPSLIEIRLPCCDVLTPKGWKHSSYELYIRIDNYVFSFEYRLKKYADIMPF